MINQPMIQERPGWKRELERRLRAYRQEKLFRRAEESQRKQAGTPARAA